MTFAALIDEHHKVSSLYNMSNVPTGVWIDEKGRIVRPGEVAYSSDKSLTLGGKKLTVEGDIYVAGLRDWVEKGYNSVYALNRDRLTKRLKPRATAEAEADASFKLAVYFHKAGNRELAGKYWEQAQKLNPDSWNYHRQDWSFTPQEASRKWMAKFQGLGDKPYYAPLEMPKPEKK